MICKHCGNETDGNLNFCTSCGQPIRKLKAPDTNTNGTVTIKRSTAIAIIAGLVAVVLITLILIFPVSKKETVSPKSAEPEKETETIVEEPKEIFPRYSTFGNFSYEKMPLIKSSVPATDEICFELSETITNFNHSWEELVNTGSRAVFYYLRANTPAYRYAEKYEKADFTESFNLIDVKDARYTGNTYFVWVHEIITEYHQSGEKTNEYHWIYKLGKDSSGYYVEDYISDPYYN